MSQSAPGSLFLSIAFTDTRYDATTALSTFTLDKERSILFVFNRFIEPEVWCLALSTPSVFCEPSPLFSGSILEPPLNACHCVVRLLTFAFCRTALSAERRGIGVGQQRVVIRHSHFGALFVLRIASDSSSSSEIGSWAWIQRARWTSERGT